MPRLLLRRLGQLRRLASVSVTHDGSIKLSLVRSGTSEVGWRWDQATNMASRVEQVDRTESRTKSISIHTSGRVNYHFDQGHTVFLPCLLDLETAHIILVYEIPNIAALDEFEKPHPHDHIVDVPDDMSGPMSFEFSVIPLLEPNHPHEVMRLGVEGLYGLRCIAAEGRIGGSPDGVPNEAFTTIKPQSFLKYQAIAEELVFLRFKKLMFATDVCTAIKSESDPNKIPSSNVIEAMIEAGPGLYPPNSEGVWTLLSTVPMRVAPKLEVQFSDPRYRAEVVELRPNDNRLSTVRVRFRVFDQKANAYVKASVPITSISLHAELF